MTLYTIGYEGQWIDEFADFLKRKKIRRIVDVRKNPLSRKKGFSKNKLAEALAARKIAYTHLPQLGVPAEWRKRAKAGTLTRAKMFRDYAGKILPREDGALSLVLKMASEENVALLCYEADAADCHRRFIAEELRRRRKRLGVVDLALPPPTSLAPGLYRDGPSA